MLVYYGGTPTWRLHTGLCKFVQNISTIILSLGKRTDLKFGEIPYLFISYNIINFLTLYSEWFSNYFFIAWQCKPRIMLRTQIWSESQFVSRCVFSVSLEHNFISGSRVYKLNSRKIISKFQRFTKDLEGLPYDFSAKTM